MKNPLTPAWLLALPLLACAEASDPVTPDIPAADIIITAPAAASTLLIGESVQLSAAVVGAGGDTLEGRAVTWSSTQPGVATVDGNGLVLAAGLGSAIIAGTSEGKVDTAKVTVGVVFNRIQVSDGATHTCATAVSGEVYCWGHNNVGQLGQGTFGSPDQLTPRKVPNEIATALHMGSEHSCASTASGTLRCWGRNQEGELGRGLPSGATDFCFGVYCSPVPLTVTGGQVFTAVGAGGNHNCGLTGGGALYCWGWNNFGQVGNGNPDIDAGVPTPIMAGTTFSAVDAGSWNSCAVAVGGSLYCWGTNQAGSVGDSTTLERNVPVPVKGGINFTKVSVGHRFACGIATTGLAYCWGANDGEQLGIGFALSETCVESGFPIPCMTTPQPVSYGLLFTDISAGIYHACGLAQGGQAYCWGRNSLGALGIGSTSIPINQPVPVTGGHVFTSISAGNEYTCGLAQEVTARGATVAYCWGWNTNGQLGRSGNPYSPGKVAFQF